MKSSGSAYSIPDVPGPEPLRPERSLGGRQWSKGDLDGVIKAGTYDVRSDYSPAPKPLR